MIRRLELAQALVNAPRLLVLDEPMVGLDPIARADVWEFIAGPRGQRGTAGAGEAVASAAGPGAAGDGASAPPWTP